MKRDKLISALWAFLLSFMLSLAAVMCPVSAFNLGIDTARLTAVCFWAAMGCSLCYWLPLGALPLGAGAAVLGFLWRSGSLEEGFEAVLNRLSRQYNKAYKWGVIRWGFRTADEMEPSILIPLCIFGALIALLTAWVVCRRKPHVFALLAALVPLASCFVVTDTVPRTGWLYLYFLAFMVLLLTESSRNRTEKQGNRLTLYTLPITALALLVLFAVVPKDTYTGQENAKKMVETVFHSDPVQLLMGQMDESGATGGEAGGNTVNLRSVGYRIESDAQVLQVISPFTGNLYLRGKALDVYDGVSWTASDKDYGNLTWPKEGLYTVGEITVTTRFAHRMLYMPYYSDTMQLLDVSKGMENDKKLSQYSFQCKRLENPAYLSKLYPTTDTRAEESQLAMAEEFMKDFPMSEDVLRWSTSKMLEITQGYTSPYHKAQAIAAYVRNSATYDLKTSRMPMDRGDFAKWFLEESETGYCVHFATATAVLLQAAGIPARYVTGYLVPVQAGEPTPVLSNQAHAWVEYWLPGYGWTVLEATPASAMPDAAPTQPQVTNPQTLPEETENTEYAPKPQDQTKPAPAPAPEKDPILMVLLVVTTVAAVLCVLEMQRVVRRSCRKKKRQGASPNELALACWTDLERYAAVLRVQLPEELLEIAQLAKYSRHTVSEEQLMQLVSEETELVRRLKKRNFLRRLYYRWILVLY